MKNFGFTEFSEKLNGRLAMLGFVIAVGTYLTTGQIIPGIFWVKLKISRIYILLIEYNND